MQKTLMETVSKIGFMKFLSIIFVHEIFSHFKILKDIFS
jgi:hypothetical protein